MESAKQLRRFYIHETFPAEGETLLLSLEETHHMRDVLRLGEGQRCLLANGQGVEFEAEILGFSNEGQASLKLLCKKMQQQSNQLYIRGFQSIVQKKKLDFLIEKSQELGINEFCPILTEFSEMRMSDETKEHVQERWTKKVKQAMKQSGALTALEVKPLLSFAESISQIPKGEKILFFHPGEESLSFKEWIQESKFMCKIERPLRLNLFLVLRGGFSPKEVSWIRSERGEDVQQLHLGENILRLETAFLGVVSALKLLQS